MISKAYPETWFAPEWGASSNSVMNILCSVADGNKVYLGINSPKSLARTEEERKRQSAKSLLDPTNSNPIWTDKTFSKGGLWWTA